MSFRWRYTTTYEVILSPPPEKEKKERKSNLNLIGPFITSLHQIQKNARTCYMTPQEHNVTNPECWHSTEQMMLGSSTNNIVREGDRGRGPGGKKEEGICKSDET